MQMNYRCVIIEIKVAMKMMPNLYSHSLKVNTANGVMLLNDTIADSVKSGNFRKFKFACCLFAI